MSIAARHNKELIKTMQEIKIINSYFKELGIENFNFQDTLDFNFEIKRLLMQKGYIENPFSKKVKKN